jgi:membrane associated rhomboid family serine protease
MRWAMAKSIDTRGLPVGTYLVLVLAALTFAIQFDFDPDRLYLNGLILHNFSLPAILGHMWLHTGLGHVLESLILLWIVGRDVCLKIGSAKFFLAYVLVGTSAALVHCGYDGREAIGASGAIMGILGMYTVVCFNRMSFAGPWIILIWFLLSLTCGILTFSAAASMDHCGGFLGGIVLASIFVFFGAAKCDETDPSLLRVLGHLHRHHTFCRTQPAE